MKLSPKHMMPLLAACAAVAVASPAFAWSQSICNPTTGQVLQGNGKAPLTTEALYYAYLHDHPGSYEMAAGGTCAKKATPTPVPTVVKTTQPTVTPAPTVAASATPSPTASPTPTSTTTPSTPAVAAPIATPPAAVTTPPVATTPPVSPVTPPAVALVVAPNVPPPSGSGATHASSSSSSRSSSSSASTPVTCVPPADLRAEAEIQLHPLTVAERCQLGSQQPAIPAAQISQPPVLDAPAGAAPQPQGSIAPGPLVAQEPTVSDIGITIETIQPDAMPIEVAGEMVEVPVAFPDAGDGSAAEITLDDVQP